ncbi:MAG: MBL fold metallo-hydrolase [Candidatus Latescibacter sp.]|nr:MBL fold metallo-hydrolase [Candidatus Latescibacter sp.]
MKVTFWGTRGSLPSPMNAAEFRSKVKYLLMNARTVDLTSETAVETYLDNIPFPRAMTFGGNTPCVEVSEGKERLILDCGTGLRPLGNLIMQEGFPPGSRIDILQTHTHWDHIMGFPFFEPALSGKAEIHIHGVHPNLRQRFTAQMDRIHFPITLEEMGSAIFFHEIGSEEEITIGPFSIRNKGLHHPGGSYAYRISAGGKNVVFATDSEYTHPGNAGYAPYVEFYRDADILIFDAMYATLEQTVEKANYGHSTAVIGVDIALSAQVKTLILFHHSPEFNDDQIAESYFNAQKYLDTRKAQFPESDLNLLTSFDGMVIDV